MKSILNHIEVGSEQLRNQVQKLVLQNFEANIPVNSFLYREPFLFAFYNLIKDQDIPLSNLIAGYIDLPEYEIDIETNSELQLHIPGLGYFDIPVSKESVELKIFGSTKTLKNRNGLLNASFLSEVSLADTNILIQLYNNPIIDLILRKDSQFNLKKSKLASIEIIENLKPILESALLEIKKLDYSLFSLLENHIRRVILIESNISYNFSAIEYNGAAFFGTTNFTCSKIWFIDSFIHEGSHTLLNLALLNLPDFFTIAPFELKFESPFRDKSVKRGIYHVTHANFVLTQLLGFYDKMIVEYSIESEEYIELTGRILLYTELLKTGLTNTGNREYYTEKGFELYNEMAEMETYIRSKFAFAFEKYILPVTKSGILNNIFSLPKFKAINKL